MRGDFYGRACLAVSYVVQRPCFSLWLARSLARSRYKAEVASFSIYGFYHSPQNTFTLTLESDKHTHTRIYIHKLFQSGVPIRVAKGSYPGGNRIYSPRVYTHTFVTRHMTIQISTYVQKIVKNKKVSIGL